MRTARILLTVVSACAVLALRGQSVGQLADDEFRQAARSVVSEGNREYDRSRRHGIRAMADSLERMLTLRSAAGRLDAMDSLEFAADMFKLRGDYHYENGNYDAQSYALAADCFAAALEIYASHGAFDGNLQCAPMIRREQAQLCYKTGDYEAALTHIVAALDAYAAAFDNGEFDHTDAEYGEYLDIMTQAAMCSARTGRHDMALARIDTVLKEYPADGESYREALRKRGKILMLAGGEGCARQALPLYKDYMQWRKADALARFAAMDADERECWWMRMRPFFADCYRLEDADPSFLYDVTLFSKGLLLQLNRMSGRGAAGREALGTLQYTWRDIQRRLTDDACAIEFVEYENDGGKRMGAIVLKSRGEPQWVPAMSSSEFETYRTANRANRERLNSTSGAMKNAIFNDRHLRGLVWNERLCEAIGDCRRVYFAPDGYMHRLPVEYMVPESLADVDFCRLTSTRRLTERADVRSDAALVVGGVIYNASEDDGMTLPNDSLAYNYMRGVGTGFKYLPYSRVESDSICYIRSCPRDTLLTGAAATESAFRELCGRYPIVNISTHGYFGGAAIPDGSDIKPCLSDESLSQSVIVMAGANRYLADEAAGGSGADGLVSARELSEMDLSQVDLAVVSACQTGLGYVTADGIYGIQRGLKNAGAGCMVVSFWNVDDRATCKLMTEFHRNLSAGMTVGKAFRAARLSLVQCDGSSGERLTVFNPSTLSLETTAVAANFSKPQYCNAFVLIDAIE